jgi:lysophospholipase L1-like esterase
MNWTRFGLLGLILIAVSIVLWMLRSPVPDQHILSRQFVIQSNLGRLPDSIVILGDSIVEGSTLPRWICGHPIINAGIGGASTTTGLGSILAKSLGGKRAALIIVSLGTNDAALSRSQQSFAANYAELLKQISTLAPHAIVMAIPPVEHGAALEAPINDYNSILPAIARQAGATFGALAPMPQEHTPDGVHLNAAGYESWDKDILREAATVCGSK